MRISDLLKSSRPIYSFEFFPPKNEEGFQNLFDTIDKLKVWNPGYVSVTYGAGGSTRQKTVDLVGRIKHEIGLESMAHLTCVGSDREEIRGVLEKLRGLGIENVLPLRGDPPRGESQFTRHPNGFGYANELVEFIRKDFDFCLGVAGYPEGHLESTDLTADLENLKRKVDAGANFIITQMFFDNRFYWDYVERVRALGIDLPILPGIMPIGNFKQISRFSEMCGASIPADLVSRFEACKDDLAEVEARGIEHATIQCDELVANGAPGIHFYTLNRSPATVKILENLEKSASKTRSSAEG